MWSRASQVCGVHLSLIIGLSVFELPRALPHSHLRARHVSTEYTDREEKDTILWRGTYAFSRVQWGRASQPAHSSEIQTLSFRTRCALTGCNSLDVSLLLLESHDQRSHIARSVTLISRKKLVTLRRKMFPHLNLKENWAVVLRLGISYTELVYFSTITSRRASDSFPTISKPDYLFSFSSLSSFPSTACRHSPKWTQPFQYLQKNIV